jgi:hypothetical protein
MKIKKSYWYIRFEMAQVLTTVRRNLKQMGTGQSGKYEEMDGTVQPSSPATVLQTSGSGGGDYNENLPTLGQDIEMTSVSVVPDGEAFWSLLYTDAITSSL